MDNVGPMLLFAFLFAVVPALLILLLASQMQHLQSDRYRALATRIGGRFVEAGFFQPREVAFRHRDTSGLVDSYTTGQEHTVRHTRVRIAWSGARVRCEVFPAQIFHRLGKLLGMNDLEIGVPEFDHDYIISGDDAQRIRELLTADVRAVLNQVRAKADFGDMYFSVARGQILLRRRGTFATDEEFEQFVRAATTIYDELAGNNHGIQFLDDDVRIDEPAATPTAICQVCGEEIAADPVLCNACRTPHHHDCWEYYGQCSTFGCRERGFHRPRRQAAAKGRK